MASAPSLIGELSRVGCVAVSAKRAVRSVGGSGSRTVIACSYDLGVEPCHLLIGRGFFHPCFAMRLGGVSGGKETQGWRDSSHTPIVGAGKFESAKLPMATATYPGKPSPSQ